MRSEITATEKRRTSAMPLLLLRHNLILDLVVRCLRDNFLLQKLVFSLVGPSGEDLFEKASPIPGSVINCSAAAELMSSGSAAYAEAPVIDIGTIPFNPMDRIAARITLTERRCSSVIRISLTVELPGSLNESHRRSVGVF